MERYGLYYKRVGMLEEGEDHADAMDVKEQELVSKDDYDAIRESESIIKAFNKNARIRIVKVKQNHIYDVRDIEFENISAYSLEEVATGAFIDGVLTYD